MDLGRVLVAHDCNPSYSGGRDQEDSGSKPAMGKQFVRPYLKKYPTKKRAGRVTQVVEHEALSLNPSTSRKKKKKKKRGLNIN
jgi:hypothetical protein